jgi:hypothetical protein
MANLLCQPVPVAQVLGLPCPDSSGHVLLLGDVGAIKTINQVTLLSKSSKMETQGILQLSSPVRLIRGSSEQRMEDIRYWI